MDRLRPLLAWLGATVLATVVAWQIVAAAGEQVSDPPLTPIAATTTTEVTTTTAGGSTTTTEIPTTTATTTTPGSTTTSSTTTTVVESWKLRTVTTIGGTVVLAYRTGEVRLQAASPAPGFDAEVDAEGPPKVDVEFDGEAVRIRVRAEWRDGDLAVDVISDVGGEDDD